MIGMAYVVNDYPLYYEASNEYGVSVAGLNFPENAHYNSTVEGKDNVASFELVPWILSKCKTAGDAKELLCKINITSDAFSEKLPPSPLHWMIADSKECIVFDQTVSGGHIYDNPTGVMTNNPTFDYQLTHLSDYMSCSASGPENHFAGDLDMRQYSRGMGGIGIPGDLCSASRFVKADFEKIIL